jgi:hypothetical protein
MITRTSRWGLPDPGNGGNEIKSSLMKKYRKIFIDKLSPADLEELQYCLKKQFDRNRVINPTYRSQFEMKLKKYFHEEIITREIASIEALIELLKPEDLEQYHT